MLSPKCFLLAYSYNLEKWEAIVQLYVSQTRICGNNQDEFEAFPIKDEMSSKISISEAEVIHQMYFWVDLLATPRAMQSLIGPLHASSRV